MNEVQLDYNHNLRGQIEFTKWTPHGHLRRATFAGTRIDTQSENCETRINED